MNKAMKRKQMFNNFKNVTLICYMKAIQKKPEIITKRLLSTTDNTNSIIRTIQILRKFDIKNDLFSTFIQLYQLKRMRSNMVKQENKGL